jgi:hypothetical protein
VRPPPGAKKAGAKQLTSVIGGDRILPGGLTAIGSLLTVSLSAVSGIRLIAADVPSTARRINLSSEKGDECHEIVCDRRPPRGRSAFLGYCGQGTDIDNVRARHERLVIEGTAPSTNGGAPLPITYRIHPSFNYAVATFRLA